MLGCKNRRPAFLRSVVIFVKYREVSTRTILPNFISHCRDSRGQKREKEEAYVRQVLNYRRSCTAPPCLTPQPEQLYVASNFTPGYQPFHRTIHINSSRPLIYFWQIHYTFSTSHSIAMRSLRTIAGSLLLAAIRPYVIRIADWSMHRRMRRRQERKERWQAKGKATWNARLPPARSTEKDSLDVVVVGGVDVSTQQQSSFFTKLPLEIRRLIYAYALGGEQLQLEVVDEFVDEKMYEKAPFRLRCPSAQRLLAFPKSCKMVYVHTYLFFFKILRIG